MSAKLGFGAELATLELVEAGVGPGAAGATEAGPGAETWLGAGAEAAFGATALVKAWAGTDGPPLTAAAVLPVREWSAVLPVLGLPVGLMTAPLLGLAP